MTKFVYGTLDDLKEIIEDLKSGNHDSFMIYNKSNGRRLRYNFDTNSGELLVSDDGIPQVNPFYKASEVEVVDMQEEAVEPTEDDTIQVGDTVTLPDDTLVQVDEVSDDEIIAHEVDEDGNTKLGDFMEAEDTDEDLPDPAMDDDDEVESDEFEDEEVEELDEDEFIEKVCESSQESAQDIGKLSAQLAELDEENRGLKNTNAEMQAQLDEVNAKLAASDKELAQAYETISQLTLSNNQYSRMTTDDYVDILVAKGYKVELSK